VLTGLMMDTDQKRLTTILAYVTLAVFLALIGLIKADLMIEALIGAGVGAGVISTQTLLYSVAPNCYGTAIRGTGVGAAVAVGRLGSIVGPILGGVMVHAGWPPGQVLLAILPLVLIGGITALPLVLRRGGGPAVAAVH
jgi:AAHS family 3-hydroxyphenylpropionic acid transporter